MSLRGRLTTAFLMVVLGPVLLGVVFVGVTVGTVGTQRAGEQLDRASSAVVTSVAALCRQLHAAASAVAVVAPSARAAAAVEVVAAGLGSAVTVTDSVGAPVLTTPGPPALPWAPCTASGAIVRADADYAALAARVELRNASGASLGAVTVAAAVNDDFITRLAAASGAAITQVRQDSAGRIQAGFSTETSRDRSAVLAVGARATADPAVSASEASTPDGPRYVRRLAAADGQPLNLLLSVPRERTPQLYLVLGAVVLLTGAAAIMVAWGLARSTTGPLAALAAAADRVADGDLAARVPVPGRDEVGRLAAAFNRMTRETQTYVQALTASRDQLRGHLEILGDTLASTHDLDKILKVILQTAMSATSAQAGVVLLLDDAGQLTGRCAENLGDRWQSTPDGDIAELKVPIGTGILGAVALTGAPHRGRVGEHGVGLAAQEPRCRSYVAVPFSVRLTSDDPTEPPSVNSRPGGVLALYDRLGAAEFDDADMSTLRTFAGQAAVAVDNVRAHEEAQRLSLTDPLTGLWNYRYLQESARREVERAQRFDRRLTVLVLDIDRFKKINDTYGHRAGDAVLVEFARRLRLGLREVDSVFRQGGEEFVVLLPETDEAGGEVVARRLGTLIRQSPVTVDARTPHTVVRIPVTTSIGLAVYPHHASTASEVLDLADQALYAAKDGGRDTYRVAGTPSVVGAPGGPQPPRQGRGR